MNQTFRFAFHPISELFFVFFIVFFDDVNQQVSDRLQFIDRRLVLLRVRGNGSIVMIFALSLMLILLSIFRETIWPILQEIHQLIEAGQRFKFVTSLKISVNVLRAQIILVKNLGEERLIR